MWILYKKVIMIIINDSQNEIEANNCLRGQDKIHKVAEEIFVDFWKFLKISVDFWKFFSNFGNFWKFLSIFGNFWRYLSIFGNFFQNKFKKIEANNCLGGQDKRHKTHISKFDTWSENSFHIHARTREAIDNNS